MKKWILYTTVTILYLFTPLCALAALGALVSLKYEVDEARTFNDISMKRTYDERIKRHQEIDQKEVQLNRAWRVWTFGLLFCPLAATGLIILRKKIVSESTIKTKIHNPGRYGKL